MATSREYRLKSRPAGMPSADNFELATVNLPEPGPGEVQVRNLWLSVDPYMRGRMNDEPSYLPPWQIGKVLDGGALGEVTVSNADGLRPGDLVNSFYGWREGFTAPAATVQKLDPKGLPPQTFLSAAGGTGLTAYAGLLEVARLKDGDVVFVSGAAGAVGSMACQIAKAKGHTVIGSAGGPEKVAFLKEIGVDHAVDYKAEPDLTAAVRRAAPDGIDVYFDNVGGDHLDAALAAARTGARFAICGMISAYNEAQPAAGPRNLRMMMGKAIEMKGFLVTHYLGLQPAFLADFIRWHAEGKLRWRETVVQGIERTPEAFLGLFRGDNTGKMLVKLN